MPLITFEKEGKTIACNAGINLRKLAKKNGISVYTGLKKLLNCHGDGLCGTCEVEIISAENLSPRTRMEEVQLKDKPLQRRLACQVTVHGDMLIRTHPPKWAPLPVEEPEEQSQTAADAAAEAAS